MDKETLHMDVTELKKITGIKAEKIDDFNVKVTITAVVCKQKYQNTSLLLIKDNCIGMGNNLEHIFQNLGYYGNIRYHTKRQRRKK